MASQLKLSLYKTLTNYGPEEVKFLRKSGPAMRAVTIPRQLVDLSLGARNVFDTVNTKGDEKVLGTQSGWKLTATHYANGKKYMCYTKTDENGECVKWGSMNLTEDEFNAMRNGLTGYNQGEWEDTVDKKPDTMDIYYGVLEDASSGIQRVCTERYIDRFACELETYRCVEPGKRDKAIIKTTTTTRPTARDILKDVYHYCVQTEFHNMVLKNCYGCNNDRPGQMDHMRMGCLEDQDVLIESYGGLCHKAIAVSAIAKAVDRLCNIFKVENSLSTENILEFYSSVDYNELIAEDKVFLYEFRTLWE